MNYSHFQNPARMGLCISLTVIMSYILAIHTTFIHLTFGFIPTAIFAILYGPVAAGIMAAIACFIGMLLFGQGVFFPGFMVSEFLVGYIYGYFLYKKDVTWKRLLLPEALITVFVHLGLNTLWLTLFYGKAASAILTGRIVKNLICFPLEIFLILLIYKAVYSILKWEIL